MSSEKQNLFSLAGEVVDERGFIDFLCALAADREDENQQEAISPSSPYGPGANGWEHGTIEDFLAAAAVWAEGSSRGTPLYQVPDNPWTRCAQILLMGKVYE